MWGIYLTRKGEVPHPLATASDARIPMYARQADTEHGYVIFNASDFNLTHVEYVKLYDLKTTTFEQGPPGSHKKINLEPSEGR